MMKSIGKKVWVWIKKNLLLTFVYIMIGVFILMIGLYFCNFHEGFSNKDSSWSSFGSYFGSISSLLAFAGILYTIHHSDKRAKVTEQQIRTQEERGVFFKMLELYQKQLDSVSYNGEKGTAVFLCMKEYIYNKINMYIIYNEIIIKNQKQVMQSSGQT